MRAVGDSGTSERGDGISSTRLRMTPKSNFSSRSVDIKTFFPHRNYFYNFILQFFNKLGLSSQTLIYVVKAKRKRSRLLKQDRPKIHPAVEKTLNVKVCSNGSSMLVKHNPTMLGTCFIRLNAAIKLVGWCWIMLLQHRPTFSLARSKRLPRIT